jgi:uncharacterized protein (TIGR02265 family)
MTVERLESQRVVFSTFFEALFATVTAAQLDALAGRLSALGLSPRRALPVATDAAIAEEVLALVAHALAPGEPSSVAFHRLGRAFAMKWAETMLGRAFSSSLSRRGPRGALEAVQRGLRTCDNFTTIHVVEERSGLLLTVNDVLRAPGFVQATIEVGLRQSGAEAFHVEQVGPLGPGFIFRVQLSAVRLPSPSTPG